MNETVLEIAAEKEAIAHYEHFSGFGVTISGKLGDDAKKYQEKLVKDAVRKVKTK